MNAAAGWRPDELVTAGRENLDVGHVRRYDSKEDAGAAGEVALLQRLGLDADAVVVDLGVGTGQFTLAVAPHVARVVAVDISPPMREQLRANSSAARLTNVEIVAAGFLSYQHAGPPADVVYSRYALHHLPDFWKAVALTRVHGMLRPAGRLRLWDVVYRFEPADAERRIEAWCATGDDDVDRGWTRAELEEHVRDEHSTYTWLLEEMLRRCGFTIEDAAYSEDGFFAQYVARSA